MKLIIGVIFFIAAIALNNASNVVTLKQIATEQLLVRSLMNTKSSYAAPCFGLYLPIYDEILQQFSESFQLCEKQASAEIQSLSEEAAGNRTLITSTSEGVCKSMTDCSAEDDSLSFFDCYSRVGDPNIKTLYSLTNNATDLAADLREQERIIEINKSKCQNASERQYTESSAATTEALNACLVYGPPEIVTTTTEKASTTTESLQTTTTVAEDSTIEGPLTTYTDDLFEEEDLSRSLKANPKVSRKKFWRGSGGRDIN